MNMACVSIWSCTPEEAIWLGWATINAAKAMGLVGYGVKNRYLV